MIRYFFIYLAVINLIAFGLFAVDKKRDPRTGQIDAVPVLRFISAEDAPAPAEEVVTL